jgi:hypothetical protein
MAGAAGAGIAAVGGVAEQAAVITTVDSAARASASRVGRWPRARLPNIIRISLAIVVTLPDRRPPGPGSDNGKCGGKLRSFGYLPAVTSVS